MIDSGGHHTHAVYAYSRQHQAEYVMAIKGASQPGKPILGKPNDVDVSWQGVRIKRGVKLWPIGSDTAKAEFYGRLRVKEPGPGFVLLSKRMPMDAFEQLTSEKLVTRYVKGRARMEWTLPPGKRNEDLDCAVYACAASLWLGIDRWADGDWSQWETRVETPMTHREEGHHEHSAQAQAAGTSTEPPASERQPRTFLDTVREQFGRQW
jgi:phage terminase large subunit GpA-like protein